MKYAKTLLVAAMFAAIAAHPARADDAGPEKDQVQIAENVPAESRNVTAIRTIETADPAAPAANGTRAAKPQGAQALMALGIALIVTPSMFAGAFSN